MEVLSSTRRIMYKLIIVGLYLLILLWFSVFFYGLVYYLYIPAVAHVLPVYLQYDGGCVRKVCKFPTANVTLVKPGYRQLLAGGQKYAIEVALEMPESEANRQQGMFMIKLSMESQTGTVLQTSNRPAVLHYRSPLFRTIYTLFFSPALLAGTFEETQKLVVSLFENYVEDSYQPTHFIIVEIQARVAEIYSAKLQIHAQFTGLRYFMYYWPLSSAFVGTVMTFIALCILTVATWVRCVMITPLDENGISETNNKPKVSPDDDFEFQNEMEPFLNDTCDAAEQQNLPRPHVQSGIEVIQKAGEQLDSRQLAESGEDSELVTSLRKRNL